MVINEDLLIAAGAEVVDFKKKEFIFSENTTPKFYYQIKEGKGKTNNYQEDGKEFIQGFLSKGDPCGESYLFNNHEYPVNAVATQHSKIIRLDKVKFLELVHENPDLLMKIYAHTAERFYYKSILINNLSIANPIERLKTLIILIKKYHNKVKPYSFQVPFTRQQLAALTGLRIETVIRSIKAMEKQKMLVIENGKILV
ncbi:hypothetical protein ASG01_02690 [Chryseobacterium sp. Leaf180]|jgi:CRP-like cAMP-binding protein|uniref:Crp/Fnr family transcriptional regulator n=1 Tax=Chryseobacterium sp. Leaf180 TaxID=1736289 RepID=UPI0007002AF7|nr:Crp/Fnr family transcriptional regulator [Chryseobacterium sp. Leaf180]KQR94794.1 hypothetical protein ASG01_02690 [Chryseobacterium sp. Leaf180]